MADWEQRVMAMEVADAIPGRTAVNEPLPFSADDVRLEIRRRKRSRRARRIVGVIVAVLVVAALVAVLLLRLPSSLDTVSTSDMEPAIQNGQVVYLADIDQVQSGDVVKYKSYSADISYGRVIACPGEWIGVTDAGNIAVSDKAMKKGDLVQNGDSSSTVMAATSLPESTYFVMGDAAKPDAKMLTAPDCFVLVGQMQGKLVFKVWPISSFGPVA